MSKKNLNDINENKNTSKNNKLPYEKEFKLEKLKLYILIVPRNHSDYFINEFKKTDIACNFVVYGKGTATKDIFELLGIGETSKDIIFSLVKENDIEKIKSIAEYRFNVSKTAKGIGFSIPLSSVAGVLMYRYLTNTKENISKDKGEK